MNEKGSKRIFKKKKKKKSPNRMQDKHKIEAVVCGLSSRDPRTKCEEKSGNERRRRNEVLISVRDKVQWMS